MNRRRFLHSAVVLPYSVSAALPGRQLDAGALIGSIRQEAGKTPVEGASWYVADAENAGFSWQFPAGTLAKARYVAADMLLDGKTLAVFSLALQEGEDGRTFRFGFGALNQASFRVRMPLELVDQNRWMIDREGAFLKPMAGGDRIDLKKVDRMKLVLRRMGPAPVRFAMTPLRLANDEVPRLTAPALPKGKLLDELGQSELHEWPAKTRSAEELQTRVREQLKAAPRQVWPERFSRWGGDKTRKVGEASGFFRTQNDGNRWWLVDPDGYAFWSAGLDCVRVDCDARYDGLETALAWLPDKDPRFRDAFRRPEYLRGDAKLVNYLAANMIRAFGPDGWRDKWAAITLSEMKRLRFNTVGNWSEWQFAAKANFPYVRPMSFLGRRCGMIYRDFPDVFHPGFDSDAADFAAQLSTSASDPAFIGYFLMNEPTWAFSSELPAAGMLYNAPACHTRTALASFLKEKYSDDAALAAAWALPATFEKVGSGKWQGVLTKPALEDLRAFSVRMVERYFGGLSAACRKADPNHLNLGMRWAGVPPEWAVGGMKSFDVFSLNCYMKKLPRDRAEKIHSMLRMPVMVGEWHFGALDAGLPATGIGAVKNQADRGRAYRVYLEDAAANPFCVGAHWFTLYDESALGRYDGENYNIGFFDVCNRPYEEIGNDAIATHERMYEVAAGKTEPFGDAPEYLPLVFL